LPNGISKCIGDVLYVPKLAKNLLLFSQLIEYNFKVEFDATKCWLKYFYSNKMIGEISPSYEIKKKKNSKMKLFFEVSITRSPK
jgi:hypothetical protein